MTLIDRYEEGSDSAVRVSDYRYIRAEEWHDGIVKDHCTTEVRGTRTNYATRWFTW